MDETEIDLRGVFGLLRRQFRLIAITFVVVVTLAGVVTFSLTPTYTTSALILVDPTRKNLLDPNAQLASTGSDSARIDSEVEILRSDNVLLRVVEQMGLAGAEAPEVRLTLRDRILSLFGLVARREASPQDALNQALSNLRNVISIQRRGLTYLIAVQARSESPERAAQLANAVAEAYIQNQVSSKVDNTLASRDILQARIDQARAAIVSTEGSFDNFIGQNIARITMETGRADLASLQSQLDSLARLRSRQSQLASSIQTSLDADNLSAVVRDSQSEAVRELDLQRAALAEQLQDGSSANPTASELQSQLAGIEERLQQEAAREVSSLRQQVSQVQNQEAELRGELRHSVLQGDLPTSIVTELFELQQNAQLARSQYETLLERTRELETQADLQIADSRIVSAALAPEFPTFPSVALFMAIAGVAALGLGVALAVLYENFIGGFTSEAQLSSVLKLRIASAIPRQRAKSERESLADVIVNAPLSVFSESVRRLRATLDQAIARDRPAAEGEHESSIIMVSSTAPSEGKTTLALALARSYVLAGKSVLLIDCDLRKPSLHRHLGIHPELGLHQVLEAAESTGVGNLLTQDPLTKVEVVAGARHSELPTDQLLTSPYFNKLLKAARKTYDVVVIDTPPIGPVVDGLYVAPLVDAIIFVARWASTSQIDARQAVAALSEAKLASTPILAVLNQQDASRASYMRKYGQYYAEVT
ncbi:GumC family protein [Devosia sp.]|uniref:GumC family protein n=1 Tax=Devosia sp. TaxID=1871048 RepID=UPI002AFE24D9|nr:Wzz/FepE/Etk N-terminal domain-containing protein [Devosia sp.]